jgi:hypothetical protein
VKTDARSEPQAAGRNEEEDSCKKKIRSRENATTYKKRLKMSLYILIPNLYNLSGRLDSNQRPPTPEAGALTGLRYTPNIWDPYHFKSAQR